MDGRIIAICFRHFDGLRLGTAGNSGQNVPELQELEHRYNCQQNVSTVTADNGKFNNGKYNRQLVCPGTGGYDFDRESGSPSTLVLFGSAWLLMTAMGSTTNPAVFPGHTDRRRLGWLMALLWTLPAVLMACMVWRYAVDVPFADDFDVGNSLYRSMTAGIRFDDLIAQHNESRPVFPRLLFHVLGTAFGWDVRYQMAASVVVVLFTALSILILARRTIDQPRVAVAISVLANVLLFSPVQWKNFLWGIQLIVFVPALSLAIIMLALGFSRRLWIAFIIAAIAAIVANYSNSNGLLVWFVAVPFFLIYPSRFRFIALGLWLVAAASSIGFYFHGYKNPGDPSIMLAFGHPKEFIRFVLEFLGNGVRLNTEINTAFYAGLGAITLWGLGLLCVTLMAGGNPLWKRSLPWISLGVYSILSGALASSARLLVYGQVGAISERYPTFAIPMWISLVPLWTVIAGHHAPKQTWRKIGVTVTVSAMATIILGLTIKGSLNIRGEMRTYVAHRLAARTVAQFALVSPDQDAIAVTLCPGPQFVAQVISQMDRIDFLPFQCFRSNDISTIAPGDQSISAGRFETLTANGDQVVLHGWAYIPPRNQLADAILFTMADTSGVQRVFAVAYQTRDDRPDVARAMHRPDLRRSGWSKTLSVSELPRGASVSAWAFDTYHRRAYHLAGTQSLSN